MGRKILVTENQLNTIIKTLVKENKQYDEIRDIGNGFKEILDYDKGLNILNQNGELIYHGEQ